VIVVVGKSELIQDKPMCLVKTFEPATSDNVGDNNQPHCPSSSLIQPYATAASFDWRSVLEDGANVLSLVLARSPEYPGLV
jgi:hypothetical protein